MKDLTLPLTTTHNWVIHRNGGLVSWPSRKPTSISAEILMYSLISEKPKTEIRAEFRNIKRKNKFRKNFDKHVV